MTIDKAKLKELALAVAELEDIPERQDEHAEAVAYLETHMHCHTILALLAEIERLSPPDGQVSYQQQMEAWKSASSQDLRARGELMIQVEGLEAENEALRSGRAIRRLTCAEVREAFNQAYYQPREIGSDGEQCRAGVLAVIDLAMAKEAIHD